MNDLFRGVRVPHSDPPSAHPSCHAGCVEVPSFGIDRSEFDDILSPFVAAQACK